MLEWLLVADTSWMQRLHVDQAVTLSLDDVPESIACRVLDVQGPVSRLAYRGELPPRAVGRLVLGSQGYLIFDEFRLAVGLRVAVRACPPYLDVAVIDGVEVPERRGGERVKLVTRARIICSDQADPERPDPERPDPGRLDHERPAEWTHTIDISESGALLHDHPALSGQQPFGLQLMFGDDPRPVTTRAEIVRRVPDAVGVRFESIPDDDATRLGAYLTGIRHQRRSASRA